MPLLIYCPGCSDVGFYFSCHEAWLLRLPRLTAVLTNAINVVLKRMKGEEIKMAKACFNKRSNKIKSRMQNPSVGIFHILEKVLFNLDKPKYGDR